ncbi:PilZ domain-containing protein [Sphingobium terrigena]|uniref:PilZ domain-containing protein n=1 Tax=Sphingobium terrigena TaxID=2304063 RepID=A0A418YUE3_9SPHN|nr:PilZ domain-containing protein [Sphingobium terrigena]RJG55795.1 PilZ domain-containing protein [Sphingobium terrigena]
MTDHASLAPSGPKPRIAARHKMFEPVVLHLHGMALRAHILDLSTSGALAHCDRPPQAGDRVRIEAEGVAAIAHVVWVRAKRFGLHFDMPLSDATVQQVVRGG